MFLPIIFKRLYLLYTGFFLRKKLHQINERFIIFPTSTIVLYKKRRKNRLFFVGFRSYRKKIHKLFMLFINHVFSFKPDSYLRCLKSAQSPCYHWKFTRYTSSREVRRKNRATLQHMVSPYSKVIFLFI